MLCYIYEDHSGYLTRGRHCLPVTSTWLHPRVLMGFMGSPPGFYGIHVAHLFSFLYCVCFCFACIRSLSFEPGARVAQWVRSLNLTTHTSLSPIPRGFAPSFVNYKKGALDSQSQVIKFTSCLPRVGGSLRVLRLPLPLKLLAMI